MNIFLKGLLNLISTFCTDENDFQIFKLPCKRENIKKLLLLQAECLFFNFLHKTVNIVKIVRDHSKSSDLMFRTLQKYSSHDAIPSKEGSIELQAGLRIRSGRSRKF